MIDANLMEQKTTTETVIRVEVTDFYWIVGVCIGVLALAAIVSLVLACTCCSCCQGKQRRLPDLYIQRMDINNNNSGDHTRNITTRRENGLEPSAAAGRQSRQAIYTKYRNTQSSNPTPRQESHMGHMSTTVTPRSSRGDVLSSPRFDLMSSRNSATFLVSSDALQQQQMQYPWPTSRHSSYHNNHKTVNSSTKHKYPSINYEQESIAASVKPQRHSRSPYNYKLFNKPINGFAVGQASILGIINSRGKDKQRRGSRFKHGKRKTQISGANSQLSIELQYFEPRIKQEPAVDTVNSEENSTSSEHEVITHREEEDTLREYNVDTTQVITAEEFYYKNSLKTDSKATQTSMTPLPIDKQMGEYASSVIVTFDSSPNYCSSVSQNLADEPKEQETGSASHSMELLPPPPDEFMQENLPANPPDNVIEPVTVHSPA